jgi:hypothetical protein
MLIKMKTTYHTAARWIVPLVTSSHSALFQQEVDKTVMLHPLP